MTLKEKILEQVQEMPLEVSPTMKEIDNYNLSVNNLEKIVEEFAINFADWIRVCKLKGRSYDFDNIKQLLQIYKQEKGL
jgi:hypothetical protein